MTAVSSAWSRGSLLIKVKPYFRTRTSKYCPSETTKSTLESAPVGLKYGQFGLAQSRSYDSVLLFGIKARRVKMFHPGARTTVLDGCLMPANVLKRQNIKRVWP